MGLKPYEIIIIGSGATGGVAALTLAKAGVKVLIIEAGPQLTKKQVFRSEFENYIERFSGIASGSYRNQAQHPGFWKNNPNLYVNEKENLYKNPKNKPFLWTQGRQLGGRSLSWGGITLRLSDYDLKASEFDGYGPKWPIEYSDLEPHYSNLEKLLRVFGNKDNLSQLPNGDCVGTLPFTKSEEYFADRIKSQLNYPVIHSRGFEPYEKNNNCEWPRFSSLGLTLKIAIATGNVQILDNHIAEKFLMHSYKDKAKGVIAIDKKNNSRKFFECKSIILCTSTIQSLKFLLSSESSHEENGFIDISNSLGKKVMDHVSTCRFFSLSNDLIIKNNEDNKSKKLSGAGSFFIPFGNKPGIYGNVNFKRGYGIWGAIDRFEPPDILKRDQTSKIGFLIGHGEVLADNKNKVTLTNEVDRWGINIPRIDFQWGDNELEMVKHMDQTIKDIITSSGGEVVSPDRLLCLPFLKNITDKAFATRSSAAPPGYYIHEVGGAPMGEDKENSVVNKWNQLWNCKNVLVVDGACWPTSSWQSPTLTMMAICRRACINLIEHSEG